jgi:hypothetical protein
MIVKHYSELVVDPDTIRMSFEMIQGIRERLRSKYSSDAPGDYDRVRHVNVRRIEPEYHAMWGGVGATIDYWIHRLLARILAVTGGRVEGLVILDLGCGSTGNSLDYEGSPSNHGQLSIWNPWLCRALHELGALPIAVDAGKLDDTEPYPHHGDVDIMETDLEALLGRRDIDLVHSHAFLGSCQMVETNRWEGSFREFYRRFADRVFPQLERVVVPGGVYLLDDDPEPA